MAEEDERRHGGYSRNLWSNGQTVRGTGENVEGGRGVPKVVYVEDAGQEHPIEATVGESVMATAVKNGVPGIIGECGGNASCGTCHVWVRAEFTKLVGEPNDLEEDLLEMAVTDRREGSRLSCQISVSPELDGLTVDVPPQQP
ncbi:2Fe-2S iron-sulfur cluster-binding protein [Modestobacter muralis]|uniref:2Fe-2S iron-sulfur cluster-binding protein n=1 Tax=Modestobacter muralis TaxID=1608614 RepID=UPI0030B86AEA